MRPLLAIFALSITAAAGLAALSTQADTLLEIYDQALQYDATLKAAEATYQADLQVEKLALSQLLPQLRAVASYSGINKETDGQTIEQEAGSPPVAIATNSTLDTRTGSYGASLEQSIFDVSAWLTLKSGRQTSQQAMAQWAAEQQDLIIRVATAYFNVLQALDDLQASKAEERAAKRQLEQTQQRFDVGLVAISDVYEARASSDNVVVQRLVAEGNVGTTYQALTVLTGSPHADLWRLSQDFPIIDPNPLDQDAWVDWALKNNYTLQAAQYAMRAAGKNASAKKAEHLPKLTGSVSYTYDDADGHLKFTKPFDRKLPQDANTDGTVWSLNVSMPLYTGGYLSAQRRQAYAQYQNSLQQQVSAERTVVQNARVSHINLLNSVQRVDAQQQTIVSTSSALRATEAGYQVGTRDILDVLQARQSLYNAIRNYASSRYSYVMSYLNLKQAAGQLSPEDVFFINQWLVNPESADEDPFLDYFN